MKNRKIIYVAIAIIGAVVNYFLKENKHGTNKAPEIVISENTAPTNKSNLIKFNFLPSSTTGQIIHHNGYSLSYSEADEQAEWVAYSLNKDDLSKIDRKRPYFYEDPKIKTKSAHWKSYKNSGYDRGHLCPAADRKKTAELFNETFLTSNITPQKHSFNTGIWNTLEQKTRYWAKKYEHLYVITGGILTDKGLKKIGKKDKVSVPNAFYKILLDYTEPEIKAIAFLLPHKNSDAPLHKFVVSIDELEQKTGIDFFPELPDTIENKLESSSNYKNWSFR